MFLIFTVHEPHRTNPVLQHIRQLVHWQISSKLLWNSGTSWTRYHSSLRLRTCITPSAVEEKRVIILCMADSQSDNYHYFATWMSDYPHWAVHCHWIIKKHHVLTEIWSTVVLDTVKCLWNAHNTMHVTNKSDIRCSSPWMICICSCQNLLNSFFCHLNVFWHRTSSLTASVMFITVKACRDNAHFFPSCKLFRKVHARGPLPPISWKYFCLEIL